MRTINIHEAKTHLSRLIDQVAAGEPFIIAKAGKPMAKVVPLDAPASAEMRRLGFMEGQGTVPDDFDEIAREEIEQLFSGGS
jgi:prevent-host-death family protein